MPFTIGEIPIGQIVDGEMVLRDVLIEGYGGQPYIQPMPTTPVRSIPTFDTQPRQTTMALGEEDGGMPRPVQPKQTGSTDWAKIAELIQQQPKPINPALIPMYPVEQTPEPIPLPGGVPGIDFFPDGLVPGIPDSDSSVVEEVIEEAVINRPQTPWDMQCKDGFHHDPKTGVCVSNMLYGNLGSKGGGGGSSSNPGGTTSDEGYCSRLCRERNRRGVYWGANGDQIWKYDNVVRGGYDDDCSDSC